MDDERHEPEPESYMERLDMVPDSELFDDFLRAAYSVAFAVQKLPLRGFLRRKLKELGAEPREEQHGPVSFVSLQAWLRTVADSAHVSPRYACIRDSVVAAATRDVWDVRVMSEDAFARFLEKRLELAPEDWSKEAVDGRLELLACEIIDYLENPVGQEAEGTRGGPETSGEGGEEEPRDRGASADEKWASDEDRALAVLIAHPDWTDTKIAEEARVRREYLYRWPKFTAARKAVKREREKYRH